MSVELRAEVKVAGRRRRGVPLEPLFGRRMTEGGASDSDFEAEDENRPKLWTNSQAQQAWVTRARKCKKPYVKPPGLVTRVRVRLRLRLRRNKEVKEYLNTDIYA